MELAKKEILRQNFRIALTDLRLPDGDGIMLLAWIKDKRPDVQVIVMTSYAEIQSAVSAIKLGAFDYLEKPVNPRILKEKIEQAIFKAMRGRRPSPTVPRHAGWPVRVIAELAAGGERIPHVERVQDAVEKAIYRSGDFDLLKTYMLYRKKHEEIRQEARSCSRTSTSSTIISDWTTGG